MGGVLGAGTGVWGIGTVMVGGEPGFADTGESDGDAGEGTAAEAGSSEGTGGGAAEAGSSEVEDAEGAEASACARNVPPSSSTKARKPCELLCALA